MAAGEGSGSAAVQRAMQWLVSTQKEDGGWGERYRELRAQALRGARAQPGRQHRVGADGPHARRLRRGRGGARARRAAAAGPTDQGRRLGAGEHQRSVQWQLLQRRHGAADGPGLPLPPPGVVALAAAALRLLQPEDGRLEYHHAEDFICKPHARHPMVSFTSVGEQPRWTADADEYGLPPTPETKGDGRRRGNGHRTHRDGISLLVTPDHDMSCSAGGRSRATASCSGRNWGAKWLLP